MKGTKGLGRVFRRPRSPYWWVSYTFRGQEIRESTKRKNKDEAVNFLKDKLAAIQTQRYVGPAADQVTVAELLHDLTVTYDIHGRASRRTLRSHVAAWTEKLGAEKAVNVSLPVLNEIVQEWQRAKRAPATINKLMASLRRAFVLGREARKVAAVPPFPRLPEHNARQGFCEWATFMTVLGELPDDGLRDFVEWAGRTAMRKGEIAKLTWQGYDRETGVVRLPGKDAKTGKPRRIVLAGPLLALVARRVEARKAHPECALIFHRDGRPVLEFRKAWASACRRAGVEGLRFHDLRRVAIRNMVRAGVSQKVAMSISGHLTDYTFRRYDITSDDDLRQAMERTSEYTERLPAAPTVEPLRRVSG